MQYQHVRIPSSFNINIFSTLAVDTLECYNGLSENHLFAQFSPSEFQPPKREKCNKAYNINKKNIEQNIKTIRSMNRSKADEQINALKKGMKNLCNNDCLFCQKATVKIYKDIEKKNLDKTMYSKDCIGKAGMALYLNFPENSCRKLNAGEILGLYSNQMTSGSISEEQYNSLVLGITFTDTEICSCSEDGCNDGPINKPTGYIYIYVLSFSLIYHNY